MSLITTVPVPNIWTEICQEHEAMRPPFSPQKPEVDLINYDASAVNPVFYGSLFSKILVTDNKPQADYDPASSHPSCVGHAFVDTAPAKPPTPEPPQLDRKTCSPREYLEYYVFPQLLPPLEAMLSAAKRENCFIRKRTKFNALDYLTEFLYKNNPNKTDDKRDGLTLFDIPFVQKYLKDNPRPPLPLSLIWTEEEAALVIQSHWRGFLVRRQNEVQELRVWQKEWRAENENIRNKVDDFWAEKMESESKVSINDALNDTLKTD